VKTKGALLRELNSEFRIDEIDLGDPVADEVQIQLHAAGMCHSDYHLTTGATPIGLPALGGHEGAGVRLEDINQGNQDMLDGKNIRGVIRYTEADWQSPEQARFRSPHSPPHAGGGTPAAQRRGVYPPSSLRSASSPG
jgi:threonine dehydrogenase-like Zn-dependent dehydrogenase